MRTRQEIQAFLCKRAAYFKKNPTPSEQRLKARLDTEGIRYQFQSIKCAQGIYRIFDFYFPKQHLVVEVDGGYHKPTYDARRDAQVYREFPRYRILRFSNEEITSNLEHCIARIRQHCDRDHCSPA